MEDNRQVTDRFQATIRWQNEPSAEVEVGIVTPNARMHCRGDLNVSLEGELVCLQCGHEVPRELARQMIAERAAARAARPAVAAKAA